MLPRDDRELLDDALEHFGLLDGFAEPDVDHDLLERRNLVRVLEPELLLELRPHRLVVELSQTRWRDRQRGAGMRSARLLLAILRFAPALWFWSAFRFAFRFVFFGCGSHVPSRLARARNRVAALDADTFLGAILVDAHTDARRAPRLRIDEHDVRGVNRRGEVHDPTLLLRPARLAVTLDDVHALDGDPPRLAIDADHFPFLSFFV